MTQYHPVPDLPDHPSLQAAERICQQRGERLTDIRRTVLALLLQRGGSMKAYDILDSLKRQRPNAAPPTVYRALDFLLQAGLVHRLDSCNAFVACHHAEHPHHGLLLICERCDRVLELDTPRLARDLVHAAETEGFSLPEQDIELKGLCGNCKSEVRP